MSQRRGRSGAGLDSAVASFIRNGAEDELVSLVLEGRSIVFALELDSAEHKRRGERRLGGITSRGLLHALWALPEAIEWPTASVSEPDVRTLEQDGRGLVVSRRGTIRREYRPAGAIRAVALLGRSLEDAVVGIGGFPPIFRRYAVASRPTAQDDHAVSVANEIGAGAATATGRGLLVHTRSAPPLIGVPAVYRWWLAERAYSAWLQANAH